MADVKVKDVMTHLVVTLYPSETVHEAAGKLARNCITGAPVVEDGKVIGMVSESDLILATMPPVPIDRGVSVLDVLSVMGRARPRPHKHGKTVADVMNPLVIQVPAETSVWRAAFTMENRGVKRLPVVDEDGYLIGIISRADLVRVMARDDDQIRDAVVDAIEVLGDESFSELDVLVTQGVATIRGMADRKTTHELAVKLASRVPGVVEVVDRMSFDYDETKRRSDGPDLYPRLNWQRGARLGERMV